MRRCLRHPLHGLTRSFEVVAIVGDQVLVPAQNEADAEGLLLGTSHGRVVLRCFPLETVRMKFAHESRSYLLRRAEAQLRCDQLAWVVGHLMPAVEADDFGAESALRDKLDLHDFVQSLPRPVVPVPSLWLSGHGWRLQTARRRHGVPQLEYQGVTLGPTDEQWTVDRFDREWKAQLIRGFKAGAPRYVFPPNLSALVADARQQVAQRGWFQHGSLLYLESPPRIGYVIPPHYNRSLGRPISKDLAITMLLEEPMAESPEVYQKTGNKWRVLDIPNGLCLGPSLPCKPKGVSSGLFSYLRALGYRIRQTGRLNEFDNPRPVRHVRGQTTGLDLLGTAIEWPLVHARREDQR